MIKVKEETINKIKKSSLVYKENSQWGKGQIGQKRFPDKNLTAYLKNNGKADVKNSKSDFQKIQKQTRQQHDMARPPGF